MQKSFLLPAISSEATKSDFFVFEISQKSHKTDKNQKIEYSEGRNFICLKKLGVAAHARKFYFSHRSIH